MSSDNVTPPSSEARATGTPAPSLASHGPWALSALALAAALFGYLDLRQRIAQVGAVPAPTPMIVEGPNMPTAAAVIAPPPPVPVAPAAPPANPGNAGPSVVAEPPPDWGCQGLVAADMVQQSVGRHGRGVLTCIATQVAADPALHGTLLLRLKVGATGAVEAAHVSGVQNDELVRCVGNDALGWQFPPPVNGACAVVEAPFAVGTAH